MDINNMRNIVILKDLPSNLVEEAIVVLKDNQKIKRFEYADNLSDDFLNVDDRNNEDEFVVREAELLVSSYIDKFEEKNYCSKDESKLQKKYRIMKMCSIFLLFFLVVSFVVKLSF